MSAGKPTRKPFAEHKTIRGAAGIVVAALICASLAVAAIENLSPLTRADQFVQDWEIASVFAPKAAQDPNIIIVAIDEETLRQFVYRSPVDRGYISNLVEQLETHKPTAIGIDFLFDQPTEPMKDTVLRHTLTHAKVPIIVSYIASGAVSSKQKAFEDAMVPAHERGLANLPTDQFDTAREVFPGAKMANGQYVPGFARALAAAAGVVTPAVPASIIWHGRPPADATDPAPKPFRQISALMASLMPDSWFRHKIVLIGSDVTLVDRHRTPFSSILAGDAGELPGIVIQAHSLAQLLQPHPSPFVGRPANFINTFLFALLGAVLGFSSAPLLLRLGAVLLSTGALWIGAIAFFHFRDILIGPVAPVLALIAAFGTLDALRGRDARHQREFIQGAFARYVSPKLVERMVEDPSRMALQGERRMMTYLFSDIQDFTTLSEKLDSKELTSLLNAYLNGMTEIIMKHDGMVDKFIGDAVFAIFNAPIDLPDHGQKAVQCMLALDQFTERFRVEQKALGIALGVTRIGVHTGMAVIGNFGSQARFTYTAQGDAVNTASRLEGINKYFGTRLCVSDATRLLCRDITFRPIASVVLKGKTEALDLWEPLQEGSVRREILTAYAAAYDRLRQGAPEAEKMFFALADEFPGDPCILLHATRLKNGAAGVTMVMTEK